MPKRYAKGKFAVGECARSGRKMLLQDMVSDGYYPSLVVDPAWYEGKHPQESLPEIEDPVALWRPAPERDQSGGTLRLRPGDGLFTGFAVRCLSIDAVDNVFDAQDADQYALKSDDPNPTGIGQRFRYDTFFRPDGLRVWVRQPVGDSHPAVDNLFQFDIPVPWQLTGWVQTASQQVLGDTFARSMEWTDNGNRLTLLGRWFASFRRIDAFDQSATPYDITVLGAGSGFTALVGLGQFHHHWNLDSQGSAAGSFCMIGANAGEYQRYPASTPGDITTLGPPDQVWDSRIDAGSRSEADIAVSTDGLKVYSVTSGGLLCSWSLTAPFDFSAPFNFTTGVDHDVPTNMGIARGMNYRPDTGDIILLADQNSFLIRCWET